MNAIGREWRPQTHGLCTRIARTATVAINGYCRFSISIPSRTRHVPSYAGPPVTARPGEVASTLRLLGYLALAIALVIFDHRGGWLSQFRVQANVATQPLWWLAGLPGRLGDAHAGRCRHPHPPNHRKPQPAQ